MKKFCVGLFLFISASATALADDNLLSGTVLNGSENAFDSKSNTYYAGSAADYAWTGLDLGQSYVITKVGWMPRSGYTSRVLLGVFEGANSPDFMDALPLTLIRQAGTAGKMKYATVSCSQGFRYVRYVGPSGSYGNVAELQFYGHEGEGDMSNLTRITNLPTVTIHTLNDEIPYDKEHEVRGRFTIIGEESSSFISEEGSFRERGNASRHWDKKPWRIKFDKKQRVLDAPAKAKKWTLINNYPDKTLMRNMLAFELSRRMGLSFTPYARSVDVLLNGEYKGTYQLSDLVQVNKHRVEIEEMTPQDDSGDELTGGYLIEIDAYATLEKSYFISEKNTPVTIKSPNDDSITTNQKEYIQAHFNKLENDWKRYLDLNTFLRHFLVGELSGNTDTYWSVFMYKQRMDDTFYTGPVWDFDIAFENDYRTYPINEKSDFVYRSGGSCTGNMKNFVDDIVISNDSAFQILTDIWQEARHTGLDEDNLVTFIDSIETELQESQELNFTRWPIMNKKVQENPEVWGSYTAEVENVRSFLRQRLSWMDNRLGVVIDPPIFAEQPYFANDNNIYEDDLNLHFALKNESQYTSNLNIYYSLDADQNSWNGRNIYNEMSSGEVLNGKLDFAQTLVGLAGDLTPDKTYTMNFFTNKFKTKPFNYPSVTFTYRDKLTLDYSIGVAGYGTLILPFDYELPEGMKVFSCPGIDENGILTLVEEESIARNTPYIVTAPAGFNHQFVGPKAIDADKPSFTSGALVGVVTNTVPLIAGTDYIMQLQNGRVAFFKYSGTPSANASENDENGNRLATPFRAFMRLDGANMAKLSLPNQSWDETDGIEEIGADSVLSAGIYSIDGKRHSELQKGLNVIVLDDGTTRKVYVK
ncbi:MAG: CotH kinase family protein [Bacteroidales bacterium]|nr:CotH kinase family protein [Bacteroidales bacterium]